MQLSNPPSSQKIYTRIQMMAANASCLSSNSFSALLILLISIVLRNHSCCLIFIHTAASIFCICCIFCNFREKIESEMAAYGALVSLMHIIDQIQLHPRPPISLDKTQVESLTEKITFLQEFLEGYSHVGDNKEADDLENRITDAAYAAEDVIESHIVDQIRSGSTSHGEKISSVDFYQSLQKVIEDMDSIKKEVMEIKEKKGVQYQLQRKSTPADSLRSSSIGQNTMEGFDDVLQTIMDKLTGQQSNLQIIPIVGMGGIGKTTLARNAYENPLIKEHFDICAWATISQEYDTREILSEVLCHENKEGRKESSENELGEMLYEHLSGGRYLIVMDDMWSIEAWDKIKFFFPDYKNGSRIVITTRLSNLAFQLSGSYTLEMEFLDEDESWKLFCKTVFGEECCPLELEEIGKKIAKGCKGLPLSITVIGGLLAKSNHTQEYWEYIEENLNSIVNSEDNERCLKILYMSYNQLPVHLKPCFLYMGVFEEDQCIRVATLIKLWVAEGFLKPVSGKSLEAVAEEYFKDLIDRNLILVHQLGSTGNIKYCNIHGLLRDLCLRESEKQKFYNFTWQNSLNIPQCLNAQRRVIILERNPNPVEKVLDALQSMPRSRSLICGDGRVLPPLHLRLLRILKAFDRYKWSNDSRYVLENMFELVNLRFLAVRASPDSEIPSSVHLLWNLHTLIVDNTGVVPFAPAEIWNMPQLRHVNFKSLHLPDPPSCNVDGLDDIVLENLQTLMLIVNFKYGEEVIKRIPNIKKLRVQYGGVEGSSGYCLNNLDRLHKLESFCCESYAEDKPSGTDFLQNLTFPHSLKKLTIRASHVHWEDMLEKIGSLPLLEKLKLIGGSFKGRNWETVEGQFRSLKFLRIQGCVDLENWTTENTHFPRLEHLVLDGLEDLNEIPSGIGEIPTLRSIVLNYCSDSAVISAKKILEEQEELGEVALQVRVAVW